MIAFEYFSDRILVYDESFMEAGGGGGGVGVGGGVGGGTPSVLPPPYKQFLPFPIPFFKMFLKKTPERPTTTPTSPIFHLIWIAF